MSGIALVGDWDVHEVRGSVVEFRSKSVGEAAAIVAQDWAGELAVTREEFVDSAYRSLTDNKPSVTVELLHREWSRNEGHDATDVAYCTQMIEASTGVRIVQAFLFVSESQIVCLQLSSSPEVFDEVVLQFQEMLASYRVDI